MQDPRHISILDYTYPLPEEKIAKHPLPERDASRLLVAGQDQLTETTYRDIAAHLPENALLIFNNTRVVEARLLFQKETGARIEIFCLEPHEQYPDITTALTQTGQVYWQCLIGGASKWKPGQLLEKQIGDTTLTARYVEKRADHFIIELSWSPASLSFAEVLHLAGAIPLPPYIKRAPEAPDAERYQTIYAETDGSVAAPTAGLHFTDRVFESLAARHIEHQFVTLHVGAGTFKPVKADVLEDHTMHTEFIDVPVSTIRSLLQHLDQSIVPVGTTSLRTIESLYWLGTKCIHQKGQPITEWEIAQWDPYAGLPAVTAREALEALLTQLEQQGAQRLRGRTQLLIAPGYDFKIADALVTNFHQPQSTLLLLIAALIGDRWKSIYQYALDHDFRFLSYGDGCLLKKF